jgi:hypothetical protein
MSDFMTQLINRRLGIGEHVLPRVRSRFEPEPAAAFLHSYNGEDAGVLTPEADVPTGEPPTLPDREQHHGEPVIESVEAGEPAFYPPDSADPVETVEPGEPWKTGDTAKRNEIMVRPKEHDDAVHSPHDYVRQEREEKSIQPSVEQPGAVMPGDSGTPVHIVTIKTREDSRHRQFRQRPSAAGKPLSPPDIPINTADIAEQAAPGSRPGINAFQNTSSKTEGTAGDEGMLGAPVPAWLTEKQKHLQSRVNAKESRAGAEPVVNVTIGRIEVRAGRSQTAPEQPRRKKKPSGVMSLDKYLSLSKRVHVNREETHEH